MSPEIPQVCKCGNKTFEATLTGLDRRACLEDNGRKTPGQMCTVTLTCTACKEWVAFWTVVPANTRWGRELQAEVDKISGGTLSGG